MANRSFVSGDLDFTRRQDSGSSEECWEGLSPQALVLLENRETFGCLNLFYEFEEEGAFATGEKTKAYDLVTEVTAFVALADHDGVDVEGVILIKGEEPHDVARIIVSGSTVKYEKAVVLLRWPDGTTENM